MAYAQPVVVGTRNFVIYNVEQAVGANAPNNRGDVTLVQYMLRGIYGLAAGDLKVDGWAGPKTSGWIRRWQRDMIATGNEILADGRIDRAHGYRSKVSKTVYGIILMNLQLIRIDPVAFACLPQAVPLNAVPKANPYNPGAGKPWHLMRISGDQVYVFYEDGTSEVFVVKGDKTYINSAGKSRIIRAGQDGIFIRGPDGLPRRVDEVAPEALFR